MRNVLLMLVSLCISLDGFGKEETYYHSYTNFMLELCVMIMADYQQL